MNVAENFIKKLREGSINEAINILKEGLEEKHGSILEEKRIEVLSNYGFSLVKEEKEDNEEKDQEDDNKEDEDEASDSDKEDEKEKE